MKKSATSRRTPPIEVRHSPIHGYGVFASRRIPKGATVIEYLGERISHARVDERYEDKAADDGHTFLFTVDARTVIDAGVNGNEARFINHSCDPNCESSIVRRRVFIDAIRTIEPGEELSYDYSIGRDEDDEPNVDEIFACRCGASACRGSMLEPRKEPRAQARSGKARGGKTRKKPRKKAGGEKGRTRFSKR
ncbi:MAG TPA: SET domain-containing protein-lysine N-methyltransferase [Steroidobacteraceae bacterium]|jgi:hypothetical protein|nr:SET domain-containing protein-lysine N-methyltransferase [Steroidobacteraceae bacterium]